MSIDPAALNLPTPKIADHELLRCIGRGSFGQVWLARNIMGEYRAVKIVYRASFETERPLTQEFEAIKKYEPKSRSHPSLLSILHVGRNTVDEYFYYIMDLADNQTTDGQPLDVERYEAKTLMRPRQTSRCRQFREHLAVDRLAMSLAPNKSPPGNLVSSGALRRAGRAPPSSESIPVARNAEERDRQR